MARPNRYQDKARREAQVDGRTLRGSERDLPPVLRALIADSIGKPDFTPADQVRNAARLAREKGNPENGAGLSEQKALLFHHLHGHRLTLERHLQVWDELERLRSS